MNVDVNFEAVVARKWQNLRKGAESRNLEFGLTLGDVKKLMQRKTCQYSGVKFEHAADGKMHPNQRTVERLDNTKGYVRGNVIVVTYRLNCARGNLSIKELKAILKVLEDKTKNEP